MKANARAVVSANPRMTPQLGQPTWVRSRNWLISVNKLGAIADLLLED